MHAGNRKTLIVKEVIDSVAFAVVVDKDECAAWWHGRNQVEQGLSLLVLINPDDLKKVSAEIAASSEVKEEGQQ